MPIPKNRAAKPSRTQTSGQMKLKPWPAKMRTCVSSGLASQEIFCAHVTQNIIDSMKAQGVNRLVCLTGAMIGDYPHLSWFMRRMKNTYQKQQPALAQDRADQEQRVAASRLDWTLIKPPRLTNGKPRGSLRYGEALQVGAMSSISRADLSRFILDQVDAREYIGKRVVVKS